jgi:AcrR family transcriptional regulator
VAGPASLPPPSYTDLPLNEIIERAGVARSTFYYHFLDKGELLTAISEDATREIVDVSDGLYVEGLHRSREKFAAAVRVTVEAWLSHVPLMNALSELAAYNPAVKEQFLAGWRRAQQRVADHIREGQAAGFVRPDLASRPRRELVDVDGRAWHGPAGLARPRGTAR